MAKSYSLDLRKKVVECISNLECPRQIAKNFKIAVATVYRWKLKIATGNLGRTNRTNYTTKVSRESVVEYVKQHPDHTLSEIGKNFNVSASTVHKYLAKMGFTYKKKPYSIKKHAL
jgi:transposase